MRRLIYHPLIWLVAAPIIGWAVIAATAEVIWAIVR